MKLAKKMIVGSTWNANTKPNLAGSAKSPKMKRAPSVVKPSSDHDLQDQADHHQPPVHTPLVAGEQPRDGDQHRQPEQAEADAAQSFQHELPQDRFSQARSLVEGAQAGKATNVQVFVQPMPRHATHSASAMNTLAATRRANGSGTRSA
jgi:hypothetical protein